MIHQHTIKTPLFIHNANGAWKVNNIEIDSNGHLVELCYRDDFLNKVWKDSIIIDSDLYAYYIYHAQIISKASLLYFNFDKGRPFLVQLQHYPPRQLTLQQAKDIIIDCINQDALNISKNMEDYALSIMHSSNSENPQLFKDVLIEYINDCTNWQDILIFL